MDIAKRVKRRYLRDPALLVFLGLILLLVPTAIGLVHFYEDAQLRHAALDLPPVPSLEELSGVVREFNSELTDPQLEVAYQATPQLRSGLLVLYKVSDQDRLVYRLAVVRHDIPCDTCRDLLVGVFLAPGDEQIRGIVPLEPWEMAEGPVNPTAFFSQLEGHSLLESLLVGHNIDGMTGASLSVQALLFELRGLGQRVIETLH